MWAGAVFQYYPRIDDQDVLADEGVVPDPDFFSNLSDDFVLPVWAICGVYHRRDVQTPDGMIFFTPVASRWPKLGLGNYICTGVLVTHEKIPDKATFMSDNRVTDHYIKGYLKELPHSRDKPRTRTLRRQNIVVGNAKRSIWWGRNSVSLRALLSELGMKRQARELGEGRRNPMISRLTENECRRLYEALVKRLGNISRRLPSSKLQGTRRGECGCKGRC